MTLSAAPTTCQGPAPLLCADQHLAELIGRSRRHPTPIFLLSTARVRENYRRFTAGLSGCRVFYPLKPNDHPAVLTALHDEGSNFDAASLFEIRELLSLGVAPERIVFTTPVKPIEEIRRAVRFGVNHFVADCPLEVEKLASVATGSRVLVRMRSPQTGSQRPLSQRFGAAPHETMRLLRLIQQRGLTPFGVAFHVGRQCVTIDNWTRAIREAAMVAAQFERRSGCPLRVLDIGGGFPVRYLRDVPSLETIFDDIRRTVGEAFGVRPLELWVEPGRAIVADAAIAVASVIGTARRGGRDWAFCDLGVFNGLLDLIKPSSRGFACEVIADRDNCAGRRRYALAGPSCDGDDVLAGSVQLPELRVGDRLYFLKVGAYSFVYTSPFCGNARPAIHIV